MITLWWQVDGGHATITYSLTSCHRRVVMCADDLAVSRFGRLTCVCDGALRTVRGILTKSYGSHKDI